MSASRLKVLRRGGGTTQRWIAVALAIFLLVDVVLVVWALTPRPGGTDPATVAASPSPFSYSSSATPSAPHATSTPSKTMATEASPPSRTLTAVDGEVAWRATTMACPGGPATVEVTEDGGTSWSGSDIGVYTDAQSILRIVADSASKAMAVTLHGEGCDPGIAGTYVGGAEWEAYPDRLPGYWFVNPSDRGTVVTSAGPVKVPCEIVTVAPGDGKNGAVLCSDRSLRITRDAGETWSDPVQIAGAANVASSSSTYIVAVTGAPQCDGISVVSIEDQSASTPVGCLEAVARQGEIAIDVADGTIWLWVGDALKRSSDGGKTWA